MTNTIRRPRVGKRSRWRGWGFDAGGFKRDLHTTMRAHDRRLAGAVLRDERDPDDAAWSTHHARDPWSYD